MVIYHLFRNSLNFLAEELENPKKYLIKKLNISTFPFLKVHFESFYKEIYHVQFIFQYPL
jgi:hypothetical protein